MNFRIHVKITSVNHQSNVPRMELNSYKFHGQMSAVHTISVVSPSIHLMCSYYLNHCTGY